MSYILTITTVRHSETDKTALKNVCGSPDKGFATSWADFPHAVPGYKEWSSDKGLAMRFDDKPHIPAYNGMYKIQYEEVQDADLFTKDWD